MISGLRDGPMSVKRIWVNSHAKAACGTSLSYREVACGRMEDDDERSNDQRAHQSGIRPQNQKKTYRATAQKKRSGDANMRFPITRFERSLDPEYVLQGECGLCASVHSATFQLCSERMRRISAWMQLKTLEDPLAGPTDSADSINDLDTLTIDDLMGGSRYSMTSIHVNEAAAACGRMESSVHRPHDQMAPNRYSPQGEVMDERPIKEAAARKNQSCRRSSFQGLG